MVTSADAEGEWTTVGVSSDIVTASWEALADGVRYGLLRAGAEPRGDAGTRAPDFVTL
jgi:2-isopropylmalate synthase